MSDKPVSVTGNPRGELKDKAAIAAAAVGRSVEFKCSMCGKVSLELRTEDAETLQKVADDFATQCCGSC